MATAADVSAAPELSGSGETYPEANQR